MTALVLNRTRIRLARHFYYPPLVILGLAVIHTAVIGAFAFGA